MATRTIGLIGGMSPSTTILYYTLINNHIASRLGGIHSANVLLRSVDYATVASFTTTKDFTAMTYFLVQRARELKAGGAQCIALCANVAHVAANNIERVTGLDVLHVADFTGREIQRRGLRKVGLMGTRAVMEEDFYRARLVEKFGLDVVVPKQEFREEADGIIFNELSKPDVPAEAKVQVNEAYRELVEDQSVDCVALACTEFRLVFDDGEFSVPILETSELHARGIAEWALKDANARLEP
jgi:aspartate racemase